MSNESKSSEEPLVEALAEEEAEEDQEENEWLRSTPKPKPKLFSYNWSQGYVSPFRATPLDKLRNFCEAVSSLGLLKGDWKDQVVYDLGCGDGIVNVEMAKLFGTRGVGLDLDETLLAKANEAAAAQGVSHLVSFCKQDLNTADYSQATILFMYLLPEALEKLKPILESFLLREGALLIVEMWPLEKWEDQVLYSHDKGVFRVYGPKK